MASLRASDLSASLPGMSEEKRDPDATWKAYLAKFDRVYDEEANAKATEEKRQADERRKELNRTREDRHAR